MNTRAAYFSAPYRIDLKEISIAPEEGQMLYTSVVQGISAGTEMLFFTNTFPKNEMGDSVITELSDDMNYPIKYGYLNIGRAEDGSKAFFFFPHQLQWFAEPNTGIPIPEDVSADDSIFLAQMETALGIAQDLNPVPGENVLIMGAGVIGLLTALVLKRSHWGNVVVADLDHAKEPWCSENGVAFIDASKSDWKQFMKSSIGDVDCCINATSSDSALQDLIDVSGFEATIIEASWYGSKPVTLNLGTSFHRKRLKLVSSQVSHIGSHLSSRWTKERRLQSALGLIRELSPSRFISHRFPFNQIQKAFECISNSEESVMQVVIDCE